MNDLTDLRHLNQSPPDDAVRWECPKCGDYAWLWPGEEPPECACSEEDQ